MPNSALRPRETSRIPLVATLLVVTVALLLAFTYATMVTQHATGIFAQGQARWMQAHSRTVMYLHRYARTGDPAAHARALDAMRIPRAYRRARGLLQPGVRDREAAVQAFMEGQLTRADAARAATFARLFRYIGPGRRVIEAWERGDAQFDSLAALAEELRRAHARRDSTRTVALVGRIDAVDLELMQLETEFTAALADAARMLPPIVAIVGALIGLVLVGLGTATLHRVARAADRAAAAELEHVQRLRALMEGLPDVIGWYDQDHRITYANPAFERLTGLPRDQLRGLDHAALALRMGASRDALATWERGLERAMAGERDGAVVLGVTDRAGRPRSFQIRFVPQQDETGAVETVLAIGRDITEVRDSEAKLRERDAQLQHAQKLEAVGRLAGGVAHEFNNILTAITANLELALLTLPEDAETRQDLHAALTAARRASGLTRQLLIFARPDAVERRPVDVGRVIQELDVMLRRLAGEQVEIAIALPRDPAIVMGDPGQLQQILLNLVSNARDAMPGGGGVSIDVERVGREQLDRRPGLVPMGSGDMPAARDAPASWVTLTVRDTGDGMTRETVQRVFEPFFTTKPPGVGTGLGLPVVSGIVTRLGGRIYLETAPGEGSAITIALPAAGRQTDDAAGNGGRRGFQSTGEMPAARLDAATARRHGVVLLVEDEAPVRAATRRMLESAGYTVLESKHAEDALMQWAQRRADIVVTDFMMPGMNGAELLARLRADVPTLPAVIVSGYTGGGAIDVAAVGTRTALLQKPFARGDLLEQMERLMG